MSTKRQKQGRRGDLPCRRDDLTRLALTAGQVRPKHRELMSAGATHRGQRVWPGGCFAPS
jgi:hypothetical protein